MYALKAVKIEKKDISRPLKSSIPNIKQKEKGNKNTHLYYTIP